MTSEGKKKFGGKTSSSQCLGSVAGVREFYRAGDFGAVFFVFSSEKTDGFFQDEKDEKKKDEKKKGKENGPEA